MSSKDPSPPLTYARYLGIDELLALQRPLSDGPEHDEHLFIVVHQVYELWFRQVLHEVDELQRRLLEVATHPALATFHRVLSILKVMVAQVDVLETMTPVSFSSFRDRLATASGFQSTQFRELELALGKRDPRVLVHFRETPYLERLAARFNAPSLWDAYLAHLATHGVAVPAALLGRDVTAPVTPSEELQTALIDVYRTRPVMGMVSERMVDLDEGLQEWRYRHVRMVERTIGYKPGTGGSAGAAYLRTTLFKPLFPDLWAIRSEL